MAKNKIQLNVDLVQNKMEGNKGFGKWYGVAVRQSTLSSRGLAEHISDHGSIYTLDLVEGVLRKLSMCIPELVGQGVAVKLDGLGTFYPTLKNKRGGVGTPKDFNLAEHVIGVHVRFLPDGTELDNLTSRAFKEKCQLSVRYVTTSTGSGKERIMTQMPLADYLKAQGGASQDDGE